MDFGTFFKCPETQWVKVKLGNSEIEIKSGEVVMETFGGIWQGGLFYECDTSDIRKWEVVGQGSRNDYLARVNQIDSVKTVSGDAPTTSTAFGLMADHGVRFTKSQ